MTTIPNDIELIESLQTGDIEAFDLIYQKYSGKIFKFALKYMRSKSDAEGLVQSVFLKIWEKHKSLRKESSFKSFLFTIAYNDMCKIFRERSYFRKYILDSITNNLHIDYKIEDGLEYQSILDQVYKIIDTLPEKQKTIFIKSRREGKSTKEISAEMNLSPGTIDNYISETLKYIRKRLNGEDYTY